MADELSQYDETEPSCNHEHGKRLIYSEDSMILKTRDALSMLRHTVTGLQSKKHCTKRDRECLDNAAQRIDNNATRLFLRLKRYQGDLFTRKKSLETMRRERRLRNGDMAKLRTQLKAKSQALEAKEDEIRQMERQLEDANRVIAQKTTELGEMRAAGTQQGLDVEQLQNNVARKEAETEMLWERFMSLQGASKKRVTVG
jgi:chromosome segregation ATPase